MSLEIPSSPVYHTSVEQKLHSKNAAKVYRYGSPKIRDQLRDVSKYNEFSFVLIIKYVQCRNFACGCVKLGRPTSLSAVWLI